MPSNTPRRRRPWSSATGSTSPSSTPQLHTVDRYPLASTPLNILLSDHVDLARNNAVVGIERQAGQIVIDARSNDRRVSGNITIVFSDPGLELRQWTITDAQGLVTTVTLRNTRLGVDLPDAIFFAAREVRQLIASAPIPQPSSPGLSRGPITTVCVHHGEIADMDGRHLPGHDGVGMGGGKNRAKYKVTRPFLRGSA